MNLVDTNVLLYAIAADAPHHEASRAWLDAALAGTETVAFAWLALVGFVRISTNRRAFEHPLTLDDAVDHVERWCRHRAARVVEPGPEHLSLVRQLLQPLGSAGNLVNDAHLAALSLRHRATVITFDNDFGRFAGVRWQQPSAPT